MRCRLCGDEGLSPRYIYCSACRAVIDNWQHWADEQHRRTGRWPRVEFGFGPSGTSVAFDSSGGYPDPNEFQERPAPVLQSGNAVEIKVPMNGAAAMSMGAESVVSQSVADTAFYLRLKGTTGCVSKLIGDVMHLYIERGSDAAILFVSRMMAKHRGLPEPAQAMKRFGVTQEQLKLAAATDS